MHVIIFHYHLLPGGVTGVIEHMSRALQLHSAAVDEIEIVTGSRENLERLTDGPPVTVIPEIGYMSRQRLAEYAPAPPDSESEHQHESGPVGQISESQVAAGAQVLSQRISQELQGRWDADSVWWVHNYHLGKNPAFTRALLEIARAHPEQRIILHIHDFPECGRYANVRYLRQSGVEDLYPDLPNLTYVTINSRDRTLLQNAGVRNVHYLPNPVPAVANPPRPGQSPDVRKRLADHFDTEFARFRRDDLFLLYPVRTIRRKNVFEAALIAMGLSQPASLVVTLPGVSQAEKQYSQMVQHAFQDGTIAGLWGIGTRLDEVGLTFEDIQRTADAIVSTSVQEGFGYQFIDPLLQGTPLVARRLPVLQDVEDLYQSWPHAFYESIRVPNSSPSLSGPQALLRFRYTERIDRLAPHIPEEIVHQLHQEVARMVESETIDFSFLLPHMQFTYLKDMRAHPSYRQEVRALNEDLFRQMESALGRSPQSVEAGAAAVDARFGLSSYATHVDEILAGSGRPQRDATPGDTPAADAASSTPLPEPVPAQSSPAERLVATFATLGYQRLLYE
ncbi:MAG: hypothetical protein R6U25_08540 [Alkalispirochaeta sp.]